KDGACVESGRASLLPGGAPFEDDKLDGEQLLEGHSPLCLLILLPGVRVLKMSEGFDNSGQVMTVSDAGWQGFGNKVVEAIDRCSSGRRGRQPRQHRAGGGRGERGRGPYERQALPDAPGDRLLCPSRPLPAVVAGRPALGARSWAQS